MKKQMMFLAIIVILIFISLDAAAFQLEKVTKKNPPGVISDRDSRLNSATYSTKTGEGESGYFLVALGFANMGEFKKALRYARRIEEESVSGNCYYKIIIEMLSHGLNDKALKTIDYIEDERFLKLAYKTIIQNEIEVTQDYAVAIQLSNKYQNDNDKYLTKRLILKDLLKSNKIEEAIDFIKENWVIGKYKTNYLEEVITYFLKLDKTEELEIFLEKVDSPIDNQIRESIVRVALRLDKIDLASNFTEDLDNERKDREYTNLLEKQIRLRRFSEAYKTLGKIQNSENRDRAYLSFARFYISNRNLQKALAYADSIHSHKVRDGLYSKCATGYLKFGETDEAEKLILKVNGINTKEMLSSKLSYNYYINNEIAKFDSLNLTISDPDNLDNLYKRIILGKIEITDTIKFEKYLTKITNSDVKDEIFLQISRRFAKMNNPSEAKKMALRILDQTIRDKAFAVINE